MPGPGGRNGGRGRKGGSSTNKHLIDSLREVCPEHKVKDLEQLVKSLNGDEEKIRERIAEWWEEPLEQQEAEWEDVNRKALKRKDQKPVRGGGRDGGRGRGRGGRGGRGGRAPEKRPAPPARPQKPKKDEDDELGGQVPPVTDVRVPQGIWAKNNEAPAAPQTVDDPSSSQELGGDIGLQTAPQPKPARAPPAGNVWATKGSAHLIQAEKPRPPVQVQAPAPVPPPIAPTALPQAPSVPVAPPPTPAVAPVMPEPIAPAPIETGTTSAWKQVPPAESPIKPPLEVPPSPVVTTHIEAQISPQPEKPVAPPLPSPSAAVAPKPPQPRPAPPRALNLGHWDTGDADDNNLDFTFGFGADDKVSAAASSNDAGPAAPPTPKQAPPSAPPAAGPSPARPPPGLAIGGMPPMPANAVLVHELENKLESTSLTNAGPEPQDVTKGIPQHSTVDRVGAVPTPGLSSQPYGTQYGGMGMYSYTANTQGNGFIGVPGAGAPILGGGVVPKPDVPPPTGLYGGPQSAPSSGNAPASTGSIPADTTASAASGMPPGMPNMPYGNPALYHYGQQPFHMGQHQGGIGYNYGYGAQFGGAVQGGFGYPQMGQSGGYGPPYDDQTASHQGAGGYQKNAGGYRGRSSHHNANQYQNQYNPQQHGGYGGQHYGMGYHGDHFNQRGGYGGMQDPYSMQHQQPGANYGGGFQDDDQFKGKKGGRGGLQQFQQGPPGQLGGQQFDLQGQGSNANQPTSGWSNQGSSTGGGAWSSGAPSWQGK